MVRNYGTQTAKGLLIGENTRLNYFTVTAYNNIDFTMAVVLSNSYQYLHRATN